ncbi:unnamed protein product [Mytilus coruscus]|uniref:Tyr recombinase domain-containing protein n=1 Tax=Mytilus coruscus TaxID=42192 RepID=A0A6J8AU41_MYTCO|nr:unnamed protein product [Mytilus coruscus]
MNPQLATGRRPHPPTARKMPQPPNCLPSPWPKEQEQTKMNLNFRVKIKSKPNPLLRTLVKPHIGASSNTKANWIKDIMKLAGIDATKFNAHSTRGSSTSKAKCQGVSLSEILKIADWSIALTLKKKNYFRPLLEDGDQFSKTVLSLPSGMLIMTTCSPLNPTEVALKRQFFNPPVFTIDQAASIPNGVRISLEKVGIISIGEIQIANGSKRREIQLKYGGRTAKLTAWNGVAENISDCHIHAGKL